MIERGGEHGGNPGDSFDLGVFEFADTRRKLEEPRDPLVLHHGHDEGGVRLFAGWLSWEGINVAPNWLACLYTFAKRMSCDISSGADLRNHTSGGGAIYKLPVLVESDGCACSCGEESRSLGQQLHASMKFQRRRLR
jgi:hypothetical protein